MTSARDLVAICLPQYSRIYLSEMDRLVAALDLELDARPEGPDFEGFAEVVDRVSAYQQELEESTVGIEELVLRRLMSYGGAAASNGSLTDPEVAPLIELVIGNARGDALEDARDCARLILPALPANELAAAGQAIGTLESRLRDQRDVPDPSGVAAGRETAGLWRRGRSTAGTDEEASRAADTVAGPAQANVRSPSGVSSVAVQPQPPNVPVPLPAAGWYADPEDSRILRRWNGMDWTSETTLRNAIARRVSFGQAVALAFKGIFTYRGRSTAGEFWWFFLFSALVTVGLYVLIFLATPSDPYERMMSSSGVADFFSLALVIWFFVYLLIVIPLIVRRLHDKGMSGWLAILIPVPIGSLVLLILLIGAGTPGPNPYGPVPMATDR